MPLASGEVDPQPSLKPDGETPPTLASAPRVRDEARTGG